MGRAHVDGAYVAGIGLIVVVCVIWTFASVLVQRVERGGRVEPEVLTYFCNSLFVVYLLPGLFCRKGEAAPSAAAGAPRVAPARAGLLLAPLWMGAQVLYNVSLAATSVGSSTALSSTSGAFALLCAGVCGVERVTRAKVAGVVLCVAGAALVSLGDEAGGGGRSLGGDAAAVASAALCGAYTTLVAAVAGDQRDVGRVLGFMGLWNGALFLAPLVAFCAFSPAARCVAPFAASPALCAWVVAKGLLDNVLADLLWAKAVLLTSPTAATLALNLTVPFAFVADAVVGKLSADDAWTGCGAGLVVCGVSLVAATGAVAPPREGRRSDSLDAPFLSPERGGGDGDDGGDAEAPASPGWTAIVPCTPRKLLETPRYSDDGGLSDDDLASLSRPPTAPRSARRHGGLSDDDADDASHASPFA